MSETDKARESTKPSALPSPSGASGLVMMLRAELKELIANSVQLALSQRQDSTSESGANGGERL